tara:strand:- start:933 stop:1718 length:786 start_codon:yes stop_codon:yes gene_type:complete
MQIISRLAKITVPRTSQASTITVSYSSPQFITTAKPYSVHQTSDADYHSIEPIPFWNPGDDITVTVSAANQLDVTHQFRVRHSSRYSRYFPDDVIESEIAGGETYISAAEKLYLLEDGEVLFLEGINNSGSRDHWVSLCTDLLGEYPGQHCEPRALRRMLQLLEYNDLRMFPETFMSEGLPNMEDLYITDVYSIIPKAGLIDLQAKHKRAYGYVISRLRAKGKGADLLDAARSGIDLKHPIYDTLQLMCALIIEAYTSRPT